MGHAMRSRVVLEHLVANGHDVHVMASQRAVDYLARRFSNVHRIHGLHIIYEENRVRRGKTFWSNVQQGAKAIPGQIQAYFDLIAAFRPDLVVSDFESWTYLYGKVHRLPVFSVDNIQMLNRCRHGREVTGVDRTAFEMARALVRAKLPRCDHYLVTTFYYPEVRAKRTTLVPPLLRPEVLAAKPERGEHLLVYQTAEGNEALAATLARTGLQCRVYGMVRAITGDVIEGNLTYRPFSESEFIRDLATARGVVAGGGFTLMGEAVYLHKPMLAVPVRRQFEQVLNAAYLEREGYGIAASAVDEASIVRFVEDIPRFEERLASYAQDGNRIALQTLDHLFEGVR